MPKSKKIGLLTAFLCLAAGLALLLWLVSGKQPGYEEKLFAPDRVHSLDIRLEDWPGFVENAMEEEYVPACLTIDGERFSQVGLRVKGNNSKRLVHKYGHSRYSLKVEMDHYREGFTYYGLDKFSLDASFQDNSYLKSWLVYDMMCFMGVPSPLCSYVWVTVNGEPWGLFLALEEPEEAFARRNFGEDHGLLYKPEYHSLKDENADVALRYTDDDPASYDNIFRKAKFPVTPEDERRLIEALRVLSTGENLETAVDVDEVLRYFAVQVFVVNQDSYLGHTGHNYFLYEKDGRLSMLPWDYNLAFGTYWLGMPHPIRDTARCINLPIDTPAEGKVMKNRPLYHQLMKDPACFARYHRETDRLLQGYFESGLFAERLDETAALIDPWVEQDPTAFCSYEDHLLAVDTLRRLCLLRAESARAQLAGDIPSTIRGQSREPEKRIDPEDLRLEDLGEVADLKDGVH